MKKHMTIDDFIGKGLKAERWFWKVNKKAYDNKLPRINIFIRDLKLAGIHGCFKDVQWGSAKPCIEVEELLSDEKAKEVLIHEIIHYYFYISKFKVKDHGKKFYKEYDRVCRLMRITPDEVE